ncbi:hypothetical protein AHF37_09009 [Paragonimus kellicotti]|nr:hypothetical protein AHF37_09009 [Paragonimus kellicotti]
MDRWYGMTIEDVRRLEEETKRELEVTPDLREFIYVNVQHHQTFALPTQTFPVSLEQSGDPVFK